MKNVELSKIFILLAFIRYDKGEREERKREGGKMCKLWVWQGKKRDAVDAQRIGECIWNGVLIREITSK